MSAMKDQPAFPHIAELVQQCEDGSIVTRQITSGGMSTRTWLAGLAMQSLLAESGLSRNEKVTASRAVGYADELLRQLEESK